MLYDKVNTIIYADQFQVFSCGVKVLVILVLLGYCLADGFLSIVTHSLNSDDCIYINSTTQNGALKYYETFHSN